MLALCVPGQQQQLWAGVPGKAKACLCLVNNSFSVAAPQPAWEAHSRKVSWDVLLELS